MKHIVHVVPGIDRIGGAERQVLLLAGGLVRRDWKVSLIALSGMGGEAARELQAMGVGFLSLGMRKGLADPRGWLRMHRWLRHNSPDVVHAHLDHAVWMARLSRLAAPVPVLVDTMHTASAGSAFRRALYRGTANLSDCVAAVSRSVSETCSSSHMVPSAQIRIIPNGVDTARWRPDPEAGGRWRTKMGLGDSFLWLAAGRLEPVKDYTTLLEAFAGLPLQAHLAIAGSGSREPELRRLSSALGVGGRVQFLGFTPDVLPWMQAADAVVLASRWEGLPMCLLEAGACSLPSVATEVPGSNEVIVDGETGFLCRPGDAESVRRTMLRLMQMAPANRRSMGLNARRRTVRQYSLASVLDRWEKLYSSLLLERPRPTRWGMRVKPIAIPSPTQAAASR